MKVRKKAVVLDAVQFFPKKHPWPEGVISWDAKNYRPRDMSWGYIDTVDQDSVHVLAGDWILTSEYDEKHHCKEKLFTTMYEIIAEPTPPSQKAEHGQGEIISIEEICDLFYTAIEKNWNKGQLYRFAHNLHTAIHGKLSHPTQPEQTEQKEVAGEFWCGMTDSKNNCNYHHYMSQCERCKDIEKRNQGEQKEAGSDSEIEKLHKPLVPDKKNIDRFFPELPEQPQQPGSGEVTKNIEKLIDHAYETHAWWQNRVAAAAIYKDIVESLQKENDLKERLLIAAIARIELQEQQISDKDKEIAELKITP